MHYLHVFSQSHRPNSFNHIFFLLHAKKAHFGYLLRLGNNECDSVICPKIFRVTCRTNTIHTTAIASASHTTQRACTIARKLLPRARSPIQTLLDMELLRLDRGARCRGPKLLPTQIGHQVEVMGRCCRRCKVETRHGGTVRAVERSVSRLLYN